MDRPAGPRRHERPRRRRHRRAGRRPRGRGRARRPRRLVRRAKRRRHPPRLRAPRAAARGLPIPERGEPARAARLPRERAVSRHAGADGARGEGRCARRVRPDPARTDDRRPARRRRSGNSGGPIVDAEGRVVGTVFAQRRGSDDGYAVPNDAGAEARSRTAGGALETSCVERCALSRRDDARDGLRSRRAAVDAVSAASERSPASASSSVRASASARCAVRREAVAGGTDVARAVDELRVRPLAVRRRPPRCAEAPRAARRARRACCGSAPSGGCPTRAPRPCPASRRTARRARGRPPGHAA